MLDMRFVRENPETVRQAIVAKGEKATLEEFLQKEEQRRKLLQEVEVFKHRRNTVSREIGRRKREGLDAAELIEQMHAVNERIKELDSAKPVYIMCHTAVRAYIASDILSQKGFDCYILGGGYSLYSSIFGKPENQSMLQPETQMLKSD